MLPFAVAFALAFVLSMAMGTWIYARFLLFALPIGVVVIVVGMSVFRSPTGLLLLLLIGAAHGLAGYTSKQPIRDAVELVARARAADDAVATIGLPDNAVGFYAQMYGFEAKPTGFLGEGLGRVIESDKPKFVFVLYPERLDRLTVATLDDAYDRTRRLEGWADWGHGAVEIWQRTR